MFDTLAWLPLLPISGCPPGDRRCPAELPPLPDAMALTSQVALACAVALVAVALGAAVILTLTRGWRWRRALTVAALAGCAGLCLLLAQKAADAYQPFARLHVPAGASYNDWALRAGSGQILAFAPTINDFRRWLILLVFAAVGLAATAVVQAASALRRQRGAPTGDAAASARGRGLPAL